ncbi:TPA: hypothetical protein JD854_RS20055 [Citrobacter amalonaticus]|uniref:Uncharacterized protein n=1 Tax=Citrobacter amalonaticus TaxID=35703 RepID=A0A9C7QMQ8_CITAM|nr:hypothetical protein [Citrobacter amalonaticus]
MDEDHQMVKKQTAKLYGNDIGIRIGMHIKYELEKRIYKQQIKGIIQTPPAQNSPSVITRVIR